VMDLDPGIAKAVTLLRDHRVSTYESCQGGPGHGSLHPVIYFQGGADEGMRAVWLLEGAGFGVAELSRIWDLDFGTFGTWKIQMKGTDG
jgi:hypothetical protein